MFLQVLLAQPDVVRRYFHQFVVIDEFQRLFQAHADRRGEQDVLVGTGGADVGQLLGLQRIDHQVIAARVNADNRTLVDLFAVADEQPAAFLQVEQRVAQAPCRFPWKPAHR